MQIFRVTAWETVGGSFCIEANSQKEAEERAEEIMDNEGLELREGFRVSHRETEVIDVEEI